MLRDNLSKRASWLTCVSLIIIFGFAVYSNTLNNKFVWDDYGLIKENSYIKTLNGTPKIITQDIGAGAGGKAKFYRPLQIITYRLDYSLWGLNVQGYHLTNTILHILVALAIYWLINVLFNSKKVAFMAGLLFVTHPVHTEAVSYISGRADSLSFLFMLLSLICYIKSRMLDNAKLYILAVLSCIFALFSKESSVILPPLILLYHYAFKKKIEIRTFLPFLCIILAYILLRLSIFRYLLVDAPSPARLLQRIPGFFVAIAGYLRLLLLPFDLHTDYGNKLFEITDIRAIGGLLMSFLLIALAFLSRKKNVLIFFSIAWFFIALVPVSNIYPTNESYMMEHWLYVPSLGFFLVLASGLGYPWKNKYFVPLLNAFALILVIFNSFLTLRQNRYWREPITFYQRNLEYTPDNWRFHNELGIEYMNIGSNEAAIASYKKALEINPGLAQVYYNLGNAYTDMGKKEEAILAYRQALEMNPGYQEAYVNLGNVYYGLGKNEEAITLYKKALEINPALGIAHTNLAMLYYYEKQYSLAIKHCDQAMESGYEVASWLLESLKPFRK